MTHIEYRLAKIGDAPEMAGLRADFFREGRHVSPEGLQSAREASERFIQEGLRDGSFVAWIALSQERIVATSGLIFSRRMPHINRLSGLAGYLCNMYTVPEYRRQGIATKLFALTMDEARARGCKRVELRASEAGRSIYAKYGFETPDSYMSFDL